MFRVWAAKGPSCAPKESKVNSYYSITIHINMTDENNSEGAIMAHYENNIHLQNEEHTKMQVVPVLSAELHIKQADFLFQHFEMV